MGAMSLVARGAKDKLSGESIRDAILRMIRTPKLTDEQLAANEATDTANLTLAAARRRRRMSSLLVGGRSVLGAYAGRGTPSGGSTGGGSVSARPISSFVGGGGGMGGGGLGRSLTSK